MGVGLLSFELGVERRCGGRVALGDCGQVFFVGGLLRAGKALGLQLGGRVTLLMGGWGERRERGERSKIAFDAVVGYRSQPKCRKLSSFLLSPQAFEARSGRPISPRAPIIFDFGVALSSGF